MKPLSLTIRVVIFLSPLFAVAVPFGPTKPLNLHGTIVEWLWRGEMDYEQAGSVATTYSSVVPAHYLIVLDVPDGDPKRLEAISSMVRTANIRHEIMERKLNPTEVLLLVPSKRLKEIKEGATLDLINYSLSGDERDTFPSHDKLMIDGKKPTLAGPLFPPEPAPKKRAKKPE